MPSDRRLPPTPTAFPLPHKLLPLLLVLLHLVGPASCCPVALSKPSAQRSSEQCLDSLTEAATGVLRSRSLEKFALYTQEHPTRIRTFIQNMIQETAQVSPSVSAIIIVHQGVYKQNARLWAKELVNSSLLLPIDLLQVR
jgi:hypothetical protein